MPPLVEITREEYLRMWKLEMELAGYLEPEPEPEQPESEPGDRFAQIDT